MKEKILVTQPFIPPLEEFMPYLEEIWRSKQLTNGGPYHQQLEKELAEYLGVEHISLFSNGTLALITALQAMGVTGEVITTPFSFVATTHALWWNNIQPVFVDIEPCAYTMDPAKIEAAITPKTTAILPVHVYGNPCMVKEIDEIAKRHGLKVLYDAAHVFGAEFHDRSLCSFGDMSILSFHATKVFNTFEGGAIVCKDAETKTHIDNLKNFGFVGDGIVENPGLNAKMNELQAAMGLLQLKYVDKLIARRKHVTDRYRQHLSDIDGLTIPVDWADMKHNYAYFPVLVDPEVFGQSRDEVLEVLQEQNIYGRRYFYPLISDFSTYSGHPSAKPELLPTSQKIANQVVCLPIYPDLPDQSVDYICTLLTTKKKKFLK